MIRRWVPVAIGAGIVVWVVALALLAVTTRDSQEFGRLQPWILMVNAAGVLVLLALLAGRFVELVRDRRALVPGSRLRSQAVAMLSVLVLAPLLLVFTFSVLFLTRGIDSWFHVEVRQGLSDALGLSRAALDLRMREFVERTERIAEDLGERRSTSLFSALDEHRRLSGAEELAVVGAGRIEAYSAASLTESVPPLPQDEVLLQARRGERYVSLDPLAGGGYVIRAAVRMGSSPGLQGPRVLLAVYPVPQRLADLAEAVQGAYQQYGRLSYLREPLKVSFVLTLSLVLLMALLAAVYGAFFFADRLVQPVQDLIGATRAVGKGDFDTRVQRASRDEIGYLVTSFNDMTKRLARARADADASRQAVENERASLAVILARLSTGVISLEPDLTIRVANHAAGAILGADLQACSGERLEDLAERQPLVAQLLAVIRPHVAAGQNDWREQVTLRHESGRRELMCACTTLPGEAGDSAAGLVLVFDDITELLHAQREAAWGEVARRLAHEIKNPLTPIQLSAERMRRRLLAGLPERDAELLDRATNTIVQQVESMKQMVNAFSEYARAPAMEMDYFDLNGLAREAAELYHAQDARVRIELSLADGGAFIEADRGRIRQVLNNLLTNSLEALEAVPDPAISVRTVRHPGPGAGFVELSVTDNGPGFHREFMGQVFDPYVTSKPKGTGLGLAIVRKIVEEHGGRIEAENEPGGGALVRVWLPADEAARGAPVPRPARNQEPRREHA